SRSGRTGRTSTTVRPRPPTRYGPPTACRPCPAGTRSTARTRRPARRTSRAARSIAPAPHRAPAASPRGQTAMGTISAADFAEMWRRLKRLKGFNPDEPRKPAGQEGGGEWTGGGGDGPSAELVTKPSSDGKFTLVSVTIGSAGYLHLRHQGDML